MKSFYLLLACILFSLPGQAEDFSLEQLMLLLASQSTVKAEFKEEKFDSFLQIPLLMSGQVSFIAPEYLEKIVHKPSFQSFILNGGKITITVRQQPSKTYSLDQHPEIRAFSESFRSTLSGDLETLQIFYDVKLTGQADDWTMQLRPINKSISKAIKKIQFNGKHEQLNRVTTWQRSGDYSVMTFNIDDNVNADLE